MREVEVHLLAKPALRPDAVKVAHQQHPHHQLGTDRRAAPRAVVPGHVLAHPAPVENRVNPARGE